MTERTCAVTLGVIATLVCGGVLVAEEADPPTVLPDATFRLVHTFADGQLATADYGTWLGIDDKGEGGSSKAVLAIDSKGQDDDAAAALTIALGEPYAKKNGGGTEQPRAHVGLLMGASWTESRSLADTVGLSFHARARGLTRGGLIVLAKREGKATYWVADIELDEEWGEKRLAWTDFEAPAEGEGQTMPLGEVTAIFIGTARDEAPGTKGDLFLDAFGFLGLSDEQKARRAQETVDIHFQKLTFTAPAHDWTWDGKKLQNDATGARLELDAYVIDGYQQVPFGNGITADPGNPEQLVDGYRQQLELAGFKLRDVSKVARIKLGRKRAHRQTMAADLPPDISKAAPRMKGKIYIENTYLKEAGRTYLLRLLMAEHDKDETLPLLRKMVGSVRPRTD